MGDSYHYRLCVDIKVEEKDSEEEELSLEELVSSHRDRHLGQVVIGSSHRDRHLGHAE